ARSAGRGEGREQGGVREEGARRRRRRGGVGRRRRRGRREAIRDVRSTGKELSDRAWRIWQQVSCRPPSFPDDAPESLAACRPGRDEAHVGSVFSILANGRWTG